MNSKHEMNKKSKLDELKQLINMKLELQQNTKAKYNLNYKITRITRSRGREREKGILRLIN